MGFYTLLDQLSAINICTRDQPIIDIFAISGIDEVPSEALWLISFFKSYLVYHEGYIVSRRNGELRDRWEVPRRSSYAAKD